ncbi:MAG: hypothetical protein A2945_04015 [Candidatus Liptonbacteria bacterium RIFCSPLOWO2_01_FULL_52_25]|uniref:Uncharacterized protein n=1 Tax=Candidatus Liptonbacteria bacterium RIFCSPLOWO2_01_FULL_52_25 TaxID=1798650 RepID=A0A1G2CC70_9BACT|nr:MAG: hypothetical protein A2945_04015 [Candidatus Liptonbacteria bacterium RIFCSPLOWO2_01_FULL_52_25]
MPRERPFLPGQLLEVSPPGWPFVGPNKENISRVRVLTDSGERMVVESAVEGVPIRRLRERYVFGSDDVPPYGPSTVIIVTPEEALQYKVALALHKFTFTPIEEPVVAP